MNIERHPCFNPKACKSHGRVHLPVAPRCNIQCNFCNRQFDCVNESRPGVSSGILSPHQAMAYLQSVVSARNNISVVGIAGPGDPFANPDQTLSTLEMVRSTYPDMLLCLATNGLNLTAYLDDVARLRVSHVSITVNAVDPSIGEIIYAWVRSGKKTLPPEKGAKLLLERQLAAITGLKERGIIVKVNTIVLPGINDTHVAAIAREMARLNVDLLNCMPYYPNAGANFSGLKAPARKQIAEIQKDAAQYLPQMMHCRRCRADAVGMLDEAQDMTLLNRLQECAALPRPDGAAPEYTPRPSGSGTLPYAAVATREGVLVNQHLGEATHLAIYDLNPKIPVLVERRRMPEPGLNGLRWEAMADRLIDCKRILVSGVGTTPEAILSQRGFEVLVMEGLINEILMGVKHQKNMNHLRKTTALSPGAACSGSGMGCM